MSLDLIIGSICISLMFHYHRYFNNMCKRKFLVTLLFDYTLTNVVTNVLYNLFITYLKSKNSVCVWVCLCRVWVGWGSLQFYALHDSKEKLDIALYYLAVSNAAQIGCVEGMKSDSRKQLHNRANRCKALKKYNGLY